MTDDDYVETAKVMSKGQVTIPKDIREYLGVKQGDRIAFIKEEDYSARTQNSALHALRVFQKAMEGEAERTGLTTDEAIMDLVREIRYGDESE